MLKLIDPASFDFDAPIFELVKASSRGLIGYDRSVFEKRASSGILCNIDDMLKQAKSDEPLVHMLAMGSTEHTGPNRNGDGWRTETLRATHPTFVKFARLYRNHSNKNPEKSYGRIIKSAFNETNPRVELIVALNGSDAAARRNGGLVADKEMHKLASGKELAVSMGATLPFDVCSYCGNKSKTPAEYCRGTHEGGNCEAGGLQTKMGALVNINGDLHHLHADNPAPGLKFFDISHVFRPADRIAYALGQLTKSAGDNTMSKSAEAALLAGITIPELVYEEDVQNYDTNVQRLLKVAQTLANYEQEIESGEKLGDSYYSMAFSSELFPADMSAARSVRNKFSMFLGALARNKVCLPVEGLISLCTDEPFEKTAATAKLVKAVLPGIFTQLLQDPELPSLLKTSYYQPVVPHTVDSSFVQYHPILENFSLYKGDIEKRATRACLQLIENTLVKVGNHRPTVTNGNLLKLAKEYALYKLAFVAAADCGPAETRLAVLQNYCN